ncbi:MAG: hypothetical protein H0V44_11150 [Planctomycetes bacterium]|nr:hypothetical protein [Planctomycetota bacterium]
MRRSLRVVAGIVLAAFSPAEDPSLRLASCDDLVRPPLLFRCDIIRTVDSREFATGPFTLTVSLTHGESDVASTEIAIAKLGDMRQGARIVLAPSQLEDAAGDRPAILRITLANQSRSRVERLTREVPTPVGTVRELQRLTSALTVSGEAAPLPYLWAEQGAEIAHEADAALQFRELSGVVSLLRGWLAGVRPTPALGLSLEAIRDPIDSSVQPLRWHRCAQPTAVALVLDQPGQPPTKAHWPAAPFSWWQAAATANVDVAEIYPAGDLEWRGIALIRAEALLAALARTRPVTLVARGTGADAAIRLARLHPGRVAAVRLIDPRIAGDLVGFPPSVHIGIYGAANPAFRAWRAQSAAAGAAIQDAVAPSDPVFWTAPSVVDGSAQPAPAFHSVCPAIGQLAHYARGPFVVVVGTREHRAAQDDNRLLAQRFVAAWAQHAHGIPPQVDDVAFDRARWRDHAWVIIGNPRSNQVLGELVADGFVLGAAWDSRSVRIGDGARQRSFPRADARALALVHERAGGARLIVLDGEPSWNGRDLPLSGLAGTLYIDPPLASEEALVSPDQHP